MHINETFHGFTQSSLLVYLEKNVFILVHMMRISKGEWCGQQQHLVMLFRVSLKHEIYTILDVFYCNLSENKS